jgi:hypothetical protein
MLWLWCLHKNCQSLRLDTKTGFGWPRDYTRTLLRQLAVVVAADHHHHHQQKQLMRLQGFLLQTRSKLLISKSWKACLSWSCQPDGGASRMEVPAGASL